MSHMQTFPILIHIKLALRMETVFYFILSIHSFTYLYIYLICESMGRTQCVHAFPLPKPFHNLSESQSDRPQYSPGNLMNKNEPIKAF